MRSDSGALLILAPCTGVTIGVGSLGAAPNGVLGNLLGRAIHRR